MMTSKKIIRRSFMEKKEKNMNKSKKILKISGLQFYFVIFYFKLIWYNTKPFTSKMDFENDYFEILFFFYFYQKELVYLLFGCKMLG